jgi:CubicO group peptidase (beta-lactamase class C family)
MLHICARVGFQSTIFTLQAYRLKINGRNAFYGYEYQFWCTTNTIRKHKTKIAMAIGFGGQRIYLIPTLNLVIVITEGNYNELTDLPDELVSKFIFPAIKK